MSISQKHGAAGRGGHSVFRGLPYDIGAIGIGQDQAGVLWKLAGWQALGDRKEKPVAIGVIIAPFARWLSLRRFESYLHHHIDSIWISRSKPPA
jgi:hypothetical protein